MSGVSRGMSDLPMTKSCPSPLLLAPPINGMDFYKSLKFDLELKLNASKYRSFYDFIHTSLRQEC